MPICKKKSSLAGAQDDNGFKYYFIDRHYTAVDNHFAEGADYRSDKGVDNNSDSDKDTEEGYYQTYRRFCRF